MPRTPKARTAPVSLPTPRLIRKSSRAAPAPQAMVPHETIALHAYWLFLERGCVHGHDLDDWLTAERELLEPQSTSIARRAAG